MDIDAILARHPRLVLVDELAHTNAPGSRHPKRYMDVEELLAAGIDVYTTLNIQHVESLNDVVAQITRIRVRETVPEFRHRSRRRYRTDRPDAGGPDPAAEGRQGLRPAQAERAVRHYFPPGNLTALARTGAAPHRPARGQPDGRLHAQPRDRGSLGRPASACWSASKAAEGHRRGAPRQAAGRQFHAPWIAISVETARSLRAGGAEQDSVADALRLAERLGAEPVLIPGQDVADTIIDYARANNVTHIIVGKSDAALAGGRSLRGPSPSG